MEPLYQKIVEMITDEVRKAAAEIEAREDDKAKTLEIGPYTIWEHGHIPLTNQVNVMWIEHDSGEGQTIDLDKLWAGF